MVFGILAASHWTKTNTKPNRSAIRQPKNNIRNRAHVSVPNTQPCTNCELSKSICQCNMCCTTAVEALNWLCRIRVSWFLHKYFISINQIQNSIQTNFCYLFIYLLWFYIADHLNIVLEKCSVYQVSHKSTRPKSDELFVKMLRPIYSRSLFFVLLSDWVSLCFHYIDFRLKHIKLRIFFETRQILIDKFVNIYMYIYIYICVYWCICVIVWLQTRNGSSIFSVPIVTSTCKWLN